MATVCERPTFWLTAHEWAAHAGMRLDDSRFKPTFAGPALQVVSAEAMVGYSEQAKCSQIAKVFDDAYKVSQATAAAEPAHERLYTVESVKRKGARGRVFPSIGMCAAAAMADVLLGTPRFLCLPVTNERDSVGRHRAAAGVRGHWAPLLQRRAAGGWVMRGQVAQCWRCSTRSLWGGM